MDDIERNKGEQPLRALMIQHNVSAHDVVSASSEQITHKMVSRACKGRQLTLHVQMKILRAFNAATQKNFTKDELFTY